MTKRLWKRLDLTDDKFDSDQISFITNFINENLEHARHVENERLTFNSIYMAMVGGALAFVFGISEPLLSALVTAILIVLGFISMLLTKRWDNVFDAHIRFARGGYRLLHGKLFPCEEEENDNRSERICIPGLKDIPLYCFRPEDPKSQNFLLKRLYKIRTRKLFLYFYWLIQAILFCSMCYFLYIGLN